MNYEQTLIDKVKIESFDGDTILLSVESFTVPEKKYMVTADFQSGTATCDCMDARCRSKMIDFLDKTGLGCKHLYAAEKFLAFIGTAITKYRESKDRDTVQCQHEKDAVPNHDAGEIR